MKSSSVSTKDNWIKALELDIHEMLSHITSNMEKYRLNNHGHELPARPALDFMIKDLVKKYVSQVEKDAIEKTNKRWVNLIESLKYRNYENLSEHQREHNKPYDYILSHRPMLSDLLEEKK